MNKYLLIAFVGLICVASAAQQQVLAETDFGPMCTPYFTTSGIQMTNGPSDPLAGWYLAHCKVQNPQNGQFVNANSITWTAQNQPSYYHQGWACVSNGQATMYYPNNCTWSSGSMQTTVTGSDSESSYTSSSSVTVAHNISGVTVSSSNSSGVATSASEASGVKSPSPAPAPSPVKVPTPPPSPPQVITVKGVTKTVALPPASSLPKSPVVIAKSSVPPSVPVVTIPNQPSVVVIAKSSVPPTATGVATPIVAVPTNVAQTVSLPPPSVLKSVSSPVIIKSSDVPPSVTPITIPGTTLVIIPATSVPATVPTTSTAPVPTGVISVTVAPGLSTFSPSPFYPPSPTPPPVVLSTIPSTFPSPPTPTIVNLFPSSQVKVVKHVSRSTVVRSSTYYTPTSSPSLEPTWFQYIPSSSVPSIPSNCAIPGVPIQPPSTLPISHVTTIVFHTHTTYILPNPGVSSSAPPIFPVTLTVSHTIYVHPAVTTIIPSSIPLSSIPTSILPTSAPVVVVRIPSTVVTTTKVPKFVTVPSTWSSPVLVPTSAVPSSVPSTQIIPVKSSPGIVVVTLSVIPSTVPSTIIVTVPTTNVITVPVIPTRYWDVTTISTIQPSVHYVTPFSPPTTVSPSFPLPPTTVIPINGVVIPETYAPASVCVFVLPSSNGVVIPEEFVPSSVPSTYVLTIPTPSPVPTSLPIPATFVGPVVVQLSSVPSTVPSTQIITIPSVPGVVVVPITVLPSTISTTSYVPVPSTHSFVPPRVSTIPTPTFWVPTSPIYVPTVYISPVPPSVKIPKEWSSPAFIPVTLLPSTVPFVTIPSQPTIVIVTPTDLPSTFPTTHISPIPSPPSTIITVPGHPSIVIIPSNELPSSVPSSIVTPVPTPVPTTVINRCVSIISHYSFPQPPSSLAFLE